MLLALEESEPQSVIIDPTLTDDDTVSGRQDSIDRRRSSDPKNLLQKVLLDQYVLLTKLSDFSGISHYWEQTALNQQ